MKTRSLLRRYPEVAFVVLAWALVALLVVLLRNAALPFEPLLILGSWTPNIAAFLVVRFITREQGGVRRLISGWSKWRVGARWYLVALSPLVIPLLAAGLFAALGRGPTEPAEPVSLGQVLSFILISVVTGAMGEELGWRGFLLPRLQQRFNALSSSLIVGVVWALWHLPLWLLPGQGWEAIPYWAFALVAVSSSVLFTHVHSGTGGSLLMASIIHFSVNFGMGLVGMVGWLPSPREAWVMVSILYTLYAIGIVVFAGPARLSRNGRTEEPMAVPFAVQG